MVVAVFVALIAEVPVFCKNDCSVHLDGIKRQRVYVDLRDPFELTVYNQQTVNALEVSIANPIGVGQGHYHAQALDDTTLNLKNIPDPRISFDPFNHIARVVLQKGVLDVTANSPHAISFNKGINENQTHNASNLMITFGTRYEPSVMELLRMPMTQFYLHGSYWSDTSYWYVFAITTGVLALVYAVFSRARPWQYLLLMSMAAFTAVFATQLHQTVLVWLRVETLTPDIARGLFGNAFGANAFPVFFAMFFMHSGKLRPKPWGVLAIVVGLSSFLLVGAGWFVGAGCLTLSGLLCLMDRVALSTISVIK